MPTVDAHSSGHMFPSHFGLQYVLLIVTNPYPKLVIFLLDYTLRKSLGNISVCLFHLEKLYTLLFRLYIIILILLVSMVYSHILLIVICL